MFESVVVPVREVAIREAEAIAAEDGSPFAQFAGRERVRILRTCSEDLEPRHRALLALRYGQDFTFARIAGEFGVSEPAVHKMHGRILARLHQSLAARGIGFHDI
jgi:RNA polymerase sigma factor (sigma-70 family)